MTWTYSGDPDVDRKDEVRWMVGDTTDTDPLVQDEEINFVLAQYPPANGKPAWLAAARTADSIAAKFARKANRSIGNLSIQAKQQRDHYRELASDLRALEASNGKQVGGMAGITPAAPILSGGGRTYLGPTAYDSPHSNG